MKENPLTSELLQVKELVYDKYNFEFSNLIIDSESE